MCLSLFKSDRCLGMVLKSRSILLLKQVHPMALTTKTTKGKRILGVNATRCKCKCRQCKCGQSAVLLDAHRWLEPCVNEMSKAKCGTCQHQANLKAFPYWKEGVLVLLVPSVLAFLIYVALSGPSSSSNDGLQSSCLDRSP